MANVPNTATFSLSDVTASVTGIGSNDLVECFAHAVDACFNATYKGSKNQLLNFRDYKPVAVPATPTITNARSDCAYEIPVMFVQWNAVSGATHYNYDAATDVNFINIVDSQTLNQSYTSFRYAGNPTYTYYGRVRSYNTGGYSAYSTTQTVTIGTGPVTNVQYTYDGSWNITISWNAPAYGASGGYSVELYHQGFTIASWSGSATSVTLAGLGPSGDMASCRIITYPNGCLAYFDLGII